MTRSSLTATSVLPFGQVLKVRYMPPMPLPTRPLATFLPANARHWPQRADPLADHCPAPRGHASRAIRGGRGGAPRRCDRRPFRPLSAPRSPRDGAGSPARGRRLQRRRQLDHAEFGARITGRRFAQRPPNRVVAFLTGSRRAGRGRVRSAPEPGETRPAICPRPAPAASPPPGGFAPWRASLPCGSAFPRSEGQPTGYSQFRGFLWKRGGQTRSFQNGRCRLKVSRLRT